MSLLFSSSAFADVAPMLSANQTHGLVLRTDGSVCGVGRNENGELGDGTSVDRYSPRALASQLGPVISVASGWYHGLAVKPDGTVWAWGYDGEGELGDNSTTDKPTPNIVPGLTGFKAVAAGERHSLGLKNDGTVFAWGFNNVGQLGDGTATNRYIPVQVIGLTNVIEISAGYRNSFALKNDGTVWSWGSNDSGSLGDGTFLNRTSAVQVGNLSSVVKITSGYVHTLALKSDGTVWAWGYNGQGELGDGSTTNQPSVVRSGALTGITDIAAGDNHSLAVASDGGVYSWGYNSNGQLGDATQSRKLIPTRLNGFSNARAVGAGAAHSLVVKTDGSFWTWGDNAYGQLGNGSTVDSLIPIAANACQGNPAVPGPTRTSMAGRIAAAQNFSLSVTSLDSVLSWGENVDGQLGDGTKINHNTAVAAAGLANGLGVAAGFYHSLLVRTDGSVASWGYNGEGELGDNTTISRITPIPVPSLSGVIAVAAGDRHSVALKADGTVWAWGFNNNGQLGDGTAIQRLQPVQVLNFSGAVAIAAGYRRTYALKADGTVWSWGNNDNGSLGDSTSTYRSTAVRVSNLTGIVAIAGGASHCLALRNDGTVWLWGYGGQGELGEGTTASRSNAVRASDLSNVVAIAAGDNHSLAVKSDGTVWSWGYDNLGQLGIGSTTRTLVPMQVNSITTALAVAAGSSHSLALLRDGSVSAWGSNARGQFGAGTVTDSTIPVHGPAGTPFGPIYNLNLTASTAGAGSINTSYPSPDGNFTSGRRVCLSGTPLVGWYFSGFSGTALDAAGCLTVSANSSITANFTALTQLRFVPATPCRIADTRNPAGTFGGPIIAAQSSRSFPIPQSACNIPANAAAYSLNVTVVPTEPLIYLTAWPTGTAQPNASVLNSFDGRIKANAAIIPAGTNGAVSIFMSNNSHVILDINGYFVPATDATALAFYPLPPCRIADTRGTTAPLGGPSLVAGVNRNIPILTSSCAIPATARSYSLNMTVVPKQPLDYLSVWPAGQTQPLVSTLNALKGGITANAAIVPAGDAGDISVFATNAADLIIDVNGYFAPSGTGGTTGLSLYNLPPCRLVDTRNPAGALPFTGVFSLNAAQASCSAPYGAQALVLNATVVPPTAMPYLSLWPYGQTQPVVSTLNADDGYVTSNLAIVPDNSGAVSAFAYAATHLILDVTGYFAP